MPQKRDDKGRFVSTGDGRAPRAVEGAVRRDAAFFVGKIQTGFYQAVTSANPVRFGWSRAGWTPSIGDPFEDPLIRPRDDEETRSAAKRRFGEQRNKSRQQAAQYLIDRGPVWITNTVPYTVFLNEGSSSQAGAKYVERSIEASLAEVRRIR